MSLHRALFPADYLAEASNRPALKIVARYPGAEWRVVRYYVNQEGGVSARILDDAIDFEAAREALDLFERHLQAQLAPTAAAA